ncbi:MAG: hypothetical protein QOG85_855 [Gaiellaceae bacterium]|nr:hypothetical protein [Gaiellaceae bacterium]
MTTVKRWIHLYDSASASGALLMPPIKIEGEQTISILDDEGILFANGVVVASSTTAAYSAAGGADFSINAGWVAL